MVNKDSFDEVLSEAKKFFELLSDTLEIVVQQANEILRALGNCLELKQELDSLVAELNRQRKKFLFCKSADHALDLLKSGRNVSVGARPYTTGFL